MSAARGQHDQWKLDIRSCSFEKQGKKMSVHMVDLHERFSEIAGKEGSDSFADDK